MKKKLLFLLPILLTLGVLSACEPGMTGPTGVTGPSGEVGPSGPTGIQGETGKSAYELYCINHPEYEGDEEQWMQDLANGKFGTKVFHTVSFDIGYGINYPSQQILHGEKAVEPKDVVYYNYEISHWTYNNVPWSFKGFPVTQDICLQAVWTEKYPSTSPTSTPPDFGEPTFDSDGREIIDLTILTSRDEHDVVLYAYELYNSNPNSKYKLNLHLASSGSTNYKDDSYLISEYGDVTSAYNSISEDGLQYVLSECLPSSIQSAYNLWTPYYSGLEASFVGYPYCSTVWNAYYNSSYYEEDDVLSLENILDIAHKNGKGVFIPSDGWYFWPLYIPNINIGYDFNDSNVQFYTDLDSDEAVEQLTYLNNLFDKYLRNGTIRRNVFDYSGGYTTGEIGISDCIYVIEGYWRSDSIKNNIENLKMADLPSYVVNNKVIACESFVSSRYYGVSSNTYYPDSYIEAANDFCKTLLSQGVSRYRNTLNKNYISTNKHLYSDSSYLETSDEIIRVQYNQLIKQNMHQNHVYGELGDIWAHLENLSDSLFCQANYTYDKDANGIIDDWSIYLKEMANNIRKMER